MEFLIKHLRLVPIAVSVACSDKKRNEEFCPWCWSFLKLHIRMVSCELQMLHMNFGRGKNQEVQ